MYNMLVHVRHAEAEKFKYVYPELALLNAAGNLISSNVYAIRNLSYVNREFQPVRANWYNPTESMFNITRKGSGANSTLSIADVELHAEHYREVFLHNWEVFNNTRSGIIDTPTAVSNDSNTGGWGSKMRWW